MPEGANPGGIDNQNESREGSILRKFFDIIGLEVDGYDEVFVSRYSSDVVNKMEAAIKSNDQDRLSGLVIDVNKAIFKQERSKLTSPSGSGLSLDEQALLNALDLMLPGNEQLNLAKQDLGKFAEEQPELVHDLLDRLLYPLENDTLDSYTAAHLLSGFYLRWIPLGRLSKFIDSKVQS